jgi:hypothetical protein
MEPARDPDQEHLTTDRHFEQAGMKVMMLPQPALGV